MPLYHRVYTSSIAGEKEHKITQESDKNEPESALTLYLNLAKLIIKFESSDYN
jgi:hypothetical protein